MTRYFLACFVLAACSHHDNAGKPDAPGKTPDASSLGPNVVTIDFGGVTPDLIAYRDGDGPWLTPVAVSTGMYTLHVTDAYELLAVCVDPMFGPDVEGFDQTFSGDGANASLPCGFGPQGQPPPTEAVTGQMKQAGQIVLGDTAMGTTAPWTFNLQVPMGMHDLIAISTANKIQLTHGIAVNAPTSMNVDLTNAASLVAVHNTVNGTLPGETIKSHTLLATANELVDFAQATGTNGFYVPASLLVTGDYQRVRVNATTATTNRWASVDPPGATTFTLLPLPSNITFGSASGDLEVTFGTLPTVEGIYLDTASTSTNLFENYSISPSYIAKTGTTKLVLDTSAPGFKPAWRVDLTQPHTSDFGISTHDANGVFLSSAVSDTASVAPAHVARLRDRRMLQPPASGASK